MHVNVNIRMLKGSSTRKTVAQQAIADLLVLSDQSFPNSHWSQLTPDILEQTAEYSSSCERALQMVTLSAFLSRVSHVEGP